MFKKTSFLIPLLLLLTLAFTLAACSSNSSGSAPAAEPTSGTATPANPAPTDPIPADPDPVTILVAAAASLEYSYTQELIPLFTTKYPWVTVDGTYDSSGKLQTQIEEGLEADVFMSAATKQMKALQDQGLIAEDSIVDLLENKIVLIVPSNSALDIKEFTDITKAGTIALGDPESVPAGQYAKEALTSLGIWDEVAAKTSFGTNVTQVLNWVAQGSGDVGIVYATDAATTDQVKVLAQAPEGSLATNVIYPVGVVASSNQKEAAQYFVDFLCSDEALAIFQQYGFSPNL